MEPQMLLPRLALPGVERLEDRCCPSVTIQIDYRFDTLGFFNAPNRRAVLQLAADTLGSQLQDHLEAITPGGENNWSASFRHPATGAPVELANLAVPEDTLIVFAGGRNLGFPLGIGGPGGGGPTSGGIEWASRVFSRG